MKTIINQKVVESGNDGSALVTRLEFDTNEVAEFLTHLIIRFSEAGGFSTQLPEILQEVGEFLDAQRITMSFQSGVASTQEISWVSHRECAESDISIFHARLPKSGVNNAIHFHIPSSVEPRESVYQLISTLIDTQLAVGHEIQTEHSQRLLAESINQISKILTSTLDRDELLSLFLDQLGELVPYDSANVMLLQDGLLYMHAARGYGEFSAPVNISKITFIPNKTFLMNEVLLGTQPVILQDTHKSPQWTWAPCGEHIRSWMGVPLRVNDRVIGLFSIDKSTPNFFTDRHAQLASALSKHAALVLDNAIMFAQLQDAHKQLRGLSTRIIEAQEKERKKIAMELHDHAGQALLALRAELQVLRYNLAKSPDKVREQIDYLDQTVLELNKDLEQLAYDLRPPTLNALGLVSAVKQYIADFGKRMNIEAVFTYDTDIPRLTEEVELVCYRTVQEALTNFAKHAQADHVEVTINYFQDRIYLVVKDNGVGFNHQDVSGRRGFGLLGITERLAEIQGSLEVHSQPEEGTELVVTIPVNQRPQ
jgi:signal transduction histidine kinase